MRSCPNKDILCHMCRNAGESPVSVMSSVWAFWRSFLSYSGGLIIPQQCMSFDSKTHKRRWWNVSQVVVLFPTEQSERCHVI